MATTTKELVLAALKDGGPATVKDLQQHTSKGETAVRDALKALRDEGAVFKSGPLWQRLVEVDKPPVRNDAPVTDTDRPARKKPRSSPGELSARDKDVLNAVIDMVKDDPDTDLSVRDVAKVVGAKDIREEDGWSATTYMSLRRLSQSGQVKRVTRWVV